MTTYLLLLAAGFIAGFINAVAGGGTLFSFPALLGAGLSPVVANATNTVALWPGSLGGAWAYRRELRANRRDVLWLVFPSLLGGLAGAAILLNTPERYFAVLVPWLLLLACALLVLQPWVTRLLTIREARQSRPHLIALWLVQFGVALYGGYFGAGIGILMLASLALFYPEDIQAANALKNLLAVAIKGLALAYFVVTGAADLGLALLMGVAAVAGGLVGARTAQRLSPKLLRLATAAYGVLIAVRLFLR
ncbi:sulfite exporter TauE/SafE family protein [bacterium]|nr:sulfite exporter TauE/SafE family protein [bacterium]